MTSALIKAGATKLAGGFGRLVVAVQEHGVTVFSFFAEINEIFRGNVIHTGNRSNLSLLESHHARYLHQTSC